MNDLFDIDALKREMNAPDVYVNHYESLYEVLEMVADKPRYDKLVGEFDSRSSHKTSAPEWSGTPNWNYMSAVVRNGWTKGRAQLSAGLNGIYQSNSYRSGQGKAVEYNIAGSYPNAALAAAGGMFCMRTAGDEEINSKPVLRVVVEVVSSAGIEAQHQLNRGAAVAALIDEIECSGVSCEIVAVLTTTRRGGKSEALICAVTLKQAGDIMSIDDIAFGLGHPSMQRRIMFALVETADIPYSIKQDWESGYGRVAEIPQSALPYDVVYLAGIKDNHHCKTPELAMEYVRSCYESSCKAIGLEVE